MREAAEKETPVGQTKFFEPIYELRTGMAVAAANGLEDRMCLQVGYHALVGEGVEGIQKEVDKFAGESVDDQAKEVKEILHYIRFKETSEKQYANGIRDKGRGSMKLSDFRANQKAIEARLSEAEVVAIRLYTTLAYIFMNNPLRDDDRYRQNTQCPLPVTTHFAASGIKKLRALHVDSGETILWRGMRNLKVANGFMEKGGTELAFMSTTRDLEVAVRYCLSPNSLLFKLVSPGFMTTGADIQWLSAFPGEAEVLYPPLTYLKPTGRTQTIIVKRGGNELSFTVVEVYPQLA
jgi:hypothetical protein